MSSSSLLLLPWLIMHALSHALGPSGASQPLSRCPCPQKFPHSISPGQFIDNHFPPTIARPLNLNRTLRLLVIIACSAVALLLSCGVTRKSPSYSSASSHSMHPLFLDAQFALFLKPAIVPCYLLPASIALSGSSADLSVTTTTLPPTTEAAVATFVSWWHLKQKSACFAATPPVSGCQVAHG